MEAQWYKDMQAGTFMDTHKQANTDRQAQTSNWCAPYFLTFICIVIT